MAENNGEGYNGGACLVCSATHFEDGHDGFYYCTSCYAVSSPSPALIQMAENNAEGYNGGACLVCSATQFLDGRDGFYYCTDCFAQTTRDGMYTGTFDENGCYIETHYPGPYIPTVPPPGLACPKCASTKLVDGLDGFYHCTDCPTKMYKLNPAMTFSTRPSCSVFKPTAPDPLPEPEPEPEWDCAMCDGSRPADCPYCRDWLVDAVNNTTL